VRVAEVRCLSTELPWKRARTFSTPTRVPNLVRNVTRLVYVQSGLTFTLREETVAVRFW